MKPALLSASAALMSFTLLSLPAHAEGDIPSPVIAECTAAKNAAELPDCLKGGAVAFAMLEAAGSADFYAAAAEPVIDACTKANDSFETTWICFEEAAEKAAETRELIGLENIEDACVAGISDPETYARLAEQYSAMRRERFPDKMYFGGDFYHPFRGCPSPAAEAQERSEALAPSADDVEGGSGPGLDANACAAFAEAEQMIASTPEAALRNMKTGIEAMDDKPTAAQIAEATGISNESAAYFKGVDESQAMLTGMLLMGFLREHQPHLLQEALESSGLATDGPAGDAGNAIAQTMLFAMLDAAAATYREACPAE